MIPADRSVWMWPLHREGDLQYRGLAAGELRRPFTRDLEIAWELPFVHDLESDGAHLRDGRRELELGVRDRHGNRGGACTHLRAGRRRPEARSRAEQGGDANADCNHGRQKRTRSITAVLGRGG